jgi:hypothetical protein
LAAKSGDFCEVTKKKYKLDNIQFYFAPISGITAAPVVYTAVDIYGLYSASEEQSASVFRVRDTSCRLIETQK